MQHFNMRVAIYRRTEGTANALGEPAETWPAVSGESSRAISLEPLSVGAMASLNVAEAGTIKLSTHQGFCQRDTDIVVGDRMVDSDSNTYVVQSVQAYQKHYKFLASLTGITN